MLIGGYLFVPWTQSVDHPMKYDGSSPSATSYLFIDLFINLKKEKCFWKNNKKKKINPKRKASRWLVIFIINGASAGINKEMRVI